MNPGAALIIPVVSTRCECTGRSKGISGSESLGKDNGTIVVDFVETARVMKNGLAPGILKERGGSKVLCIPGLPCATEGHLFGERNQHGTCELVSYSKIRRESSFRCPVKFGPICRLWHSVDWSSVRISHHKAGKRLELTNVSEHVGGSLYYMLRGMAVTSYFLSSITWIR